MHPLPTQPRARQWLDRAWWAWLAILLAYLFSLYRTNSLCNYSATDFRGYYASAQIAWQQGFARVYHQPTQDEYQARLPLPCPDGSLAAPPLRVSMPYLPAFVIFLLPLPALEFSTSYIVWTVLNLAVLVLYTRHFCAALAEPAGWHQPLALPVSTGKGACLLPVSRLQPEATAKSGPAKASKPIQGRRLILFQWAVCLPLLANLSLGQMNVFLLVCLGEFTLSLARGREMHSGFWLGGMLLKPHTLILLLPGLVLSRRWKPLAGFLASFGIILGGSFLLAGTQGLQGMLHMVDQFASPAFQTAPTMMNWRSLALNLQTYLPAGLAWGIAFAGTLLVALLALSLWRPPAAQPEAKPKAIPPGRGLQTDPAQAKPPARGLVTLILASYAATCSIAWHAHFYMLLPMIPFLAYLDTQDGVPAGLLALWIWGAPLFYLLLNWLAPSLSRNGLGIWVLALNLLFFAWLYLPLARARRSAYQ
jgi:hypothetical protein